MILIWFDGRKKYYGGICHSIFYYTKANNKNIKNDDKNKESPYLQYWHINSLYPWAMLQKVSVNNFDWIKDTSQFNEDFTKNYIEENDEGYFLEFDPQYLKILHELHNDLPFFPKFKKSKSLYLTYMIEVNMLHT